jgi:hypothetical protein
MAKYNYLIRQKRKAINFINILYHIGIFNKKELDELTGNIKDQLD